jgi:hypothetical protein
MKPAHCHSGAVQDLVDLHELLHSSSVFSELSAGDVSLNILLVGSCAFYHNFIWGGEGSSCNLPVAASQKGNMKTTAAINAYKNMLAASR